MTMTKEAMQRQGKSWRPADRQRSLGESNGEAKNSVFYAGPFFSTFIEEREKNQCAVPSSPLFSRDSLARELGWMDLGILRTGMLDSFVATSILN